MPDFEALQTEARKDIDVALEVWSNILKSRFPRNDEYAYAKGSAVKPWDSPIDYVPIISDLDIHVRTVDATLFHEDDEFAEAIGISSQYDLTFIEKRPDCLHVPRSQLVLLGKIEEFDNYVPPRREDIRPLFGEIHMQNIPSVSRIREIDRSNLLSVEPFLDSFAMSVVDRTGIDLWTVIRRLNWRVSHAPIQVVTQCHDDPIEVWSWNRSKLRGELEHMGFDQIAELYSDFYLSGWDLFLSDFKGPEEYKSVVENGYYLLRRCIQQLKETE